VTRYLCALPWVGRVLQAALGTALAMMIAFYGYLYLNDPLSIDTVSGLMIGPSDLKLYLTGDKRFGDCPGHWYVTLRTDTETALLTSVVQRTGGVPEGRMNEVPVQTHFARPPKLGAYTATLHVQYDCLLPFRHQASFELVVR
jgi:hypothetical protein